MSDHRMNSWRCSSVILPVSVRSRIAASHSSSVSPTSVANAWRWAVRDSTSRRRRSSGQPAKLATAAAVMSAGVVRPSARADGRLGHSTASTGSTLATAARTKSAESRRASSSSGWRSHSWISTTPPRPSVTGHRHGDALDAVLALEHDRCRPELSVTVQRGDHARDAEAGRPRRRPPGVERDVNRIPGAEVLLRGPCLVGRGADRGAVHRHAVEQRNGLVAVLAEHPRLDAARRDPERLRETRPQPQAVVDRVADDPAAVEAGAPPESRHQRVDRVGDHDDDALPRRPERVRELVGDQGVPREVLDARRSGGDRGRRQQHDDVGIGHVLYVAAAHAAPGGELQHLVEVHHVRRDHLGPAVDEDDLVGPPASGRG